MIDRFSTAICKKLNICINPFHADALFPYPLKTKCFLTILEVIEIEIGVKKVNTMG